MIMAEKKPDSKKTRDSTTNKEYLARILTKLEEIATLLTKQNEMLTESKEQMTTETSDEYNEPPEDTSYAPGYSGEEEEEEENRSFASTDESGYRREEEYTEEYQAGSSENRWRPPHWEYKRNDHRASPEPETSPFQDRNDQETFFEPDENTGDEERDNPEDRYRPKTPRCPLCGMITQYSEEEDDHYCWMCEKYIKEME